jgi:hypothetical protein
MIIGLSARHSQSYRAEGLESVTHWGDVRVAGRCGTLQAPMSATSSLAKNAVLAACVVAGGARLYVRDHAERARFALAEQRLDRATDELAATRAELSALGSRAPTTVAVTSPAPDPALAETVAARVVSAQNARAKAEAAIADDAAQPTAEMLARRDQAKQTLDGAVSRGVLRRDDVRAIRQALSEDTAGRDEAARQIAVAINTRKLVPEDMHSVFP